MVDVVRRDSTGLTIGILRKDTERGYMLGLRRAWLYYVPAQGQEFYDIWEVKPVRASDDSKRPARVIWSGLHVSRVFSLSEGSPEEAVEDGAWVSAPTREGALLVIDRMGANRERC